MRTRKAYSEEQIAEIEAARKETKDKNVDRRLKAVQLYGQGAKASEIAQSTEYAVSYIYELTAKYQSEGLGALTENHYKGNRRNMSYEEEAAFLEDFRAEAEAGNVVDVRDIKRALAEKLGYETKSRGYIYTLLERHNWRKVMPRSRHPKAADEATVEASKKLTLP